MLNSRIIDSVKIGSRYYVTGNTYPRRAELKAAGFRWDPEQKAWWTTSAKEANRVVDELWAEHRKAEAARYAAEQKAHEGYRWTWRREQWRDDTGKWAVWHDMDDDDDMYDGISGFSGGWFGWEKIEKPAPKTCKISLAKLAQAAAARLAAAAEAKAEAAKAAEPARKISLRPVVAAAVKGAAHAVRSARAKRAWETRRRNAARTAEILSATCEPLVVDADALPASVSYSATPGSECCYGRAAHGTCGRVIARADVWCDRGTVVTNGKDDVQILVDHTLRRVDTSRCPHVTPCDPRDTRAVMFDSLCRPPAEGRRERRNARRRELYRLRKAA